MTPFVHGFIYGGFWLPLLFALAIMRRGASIALLDS